MASDDPMPYEAPSGLRFVKLYPVEGESAIAEIWFGEEPIGQLSLRGVRQEAVGAARAVDAQVELAIYPSPDTVQWSLPLSDFLAQIEKARAWLMQNEEGRTPVAGGLTASGSAFDKIAGSDDLWQGDRP